MNAKAWIEFLERRLALSVLGLSLIPYLCLLGYLYFGMHSDSDVQSVPHPSVFVGLFGLGVLIPIGGLTLIIRGLLKQRNEFRIRLLLEAYVSLILIFSTAFAVLQAGSESASFKEMPIVWAHDLPATFGEHATKLHEVYFDSLYLSVITITTVGYGDLAPITAMAKIFTGLEGLAGVGFLGLVLGHYFSVCLHGREGHSTASRTKEDSS